MHKYGLYILIMVASYITNVNASSDKVIQIATGEWPPYSGKKLPHNGCVLKLITDIYKTQGYKVKYRFLPWTRAYQEAKLGKSDGTAYWYDGENRRKDFIFPRSHISIEESFFFYNKKNHFNWSKFSDLKGQSIILNRGYTYSKKFFEAIKKYNIKTIYVTNSKQNFLMLAQERASLTIVADEPAKNFLKEIDPKSAAKIQKHPLPALVAKSYFLISKKIPEAQELKNAFDKGYETVFSNKNYKKDFKKNCSIF